MQILTRRGFVKMAGLASAAGIAGMSLAGCGSNQESKGASDTPSKVVVAMSTSSEPAAGFDPCIAWGCGEHVHEPLIQSTLITTDINLEFVNDLATEYSCSDDGLIWTFKIRDDVKFTDGEPLTAKDVAFTINTINESKKSEADLSSVKKAVAVDDTTVEFRMSKPNNTLLYTLAVVGIVPEHAYDNNYGAAPIGSGRYKMVQWDKGSRSSSRPTRITTASPSRCSSSSSSSWTRTPRWLAARPARSTSPTPPRLCTTACPRAMSC